MTMEIKVSEFAYGKIRYRMPNAIESTALLGHMGMSFSSARLAASLAESDFVWLSKLMGQLKPLIVEIDAEVDDVKISDWESAIDSQALAPTLRGIAAEVMVYVMMPFSEKKTKPAATTNPSVTTQTATARKKSRARRKR